MNEQEEYILDVHELACASHEVPFDKRSFARGSNEPRWTTAQGRTLLVSQMDPDHLINATNFKRKQLKEVDVALQELGLTLSREPHNADELAPEFIKLVAAQEEIEGAIRVLMNETNRRDERKNRKASLRFVEPAAESVEAEL
jgi:hypothetical protein